MCDSPTKTQYRPIAEVVQEATNGGQLIVEFLVDVVVGNIEGANIWHRMEATRQLQRLGVKIPNAVKQAVSTPSNGAKPERAPGKPEPKDELADIIREETDGGRDIVRFLMDAMQGKLEDFKPRHRLAASDRLITRGFDNLPGHTVVADEDGNDEPMSHELPANRARRNAKQYNDDDAPFDFDNYTIEEYERDRAGLRAKLHIYGGEEAWEVALDANRKHWDESYATDQVGDYNTTPIKNPGDDPFGKGSYGYKCLKIAFQDNNAVRAANRAVLEYHKRKFKHLINEDGSLNALTDTTSLDPQTLQYLERNRHLLAHNDDKPPEDSDPPGVVILSEAEGSPASAQPSSSAAPDQPQNTRVGEGFKPSRGYGHCRDCSETVGEDFKPSLDPEGPPAPEPPPRNKRPIIHLGPPSEDDPPDDDSRRYRDPDEIRVPLKDLVSISPVPF